MKTRLTQIVLSLSLILVLFGLSACSSTSTQNGVSIQQQRSLNPLDYIPSFK